MEVMVVVVEVMVWSGVVVWRDGVVMVVVAVVVCCLLFLSSSFTHR